MQVTVIKPLSTACDAQSICSVPQIAGHNSIDIHLLEIKNAYGAVRGDFMNVILSSNQNQIKQCQHKIGIISEPVFSIQMRIQNTNAIYKL